MQFWAGASNVDQDLASFKCIQCCESQRENVCPQRWHELKTNAL